MGTEAGVLFALGALLFWGFGDFLIQKSTRKIGDWETLFLIALFGVIILTPFVYKDPSSLSENSFFVLFIVSAILFIAALLDFEALKEGKLAIVEPIIALEVPVSVILAFTIIKEEISLLEIAFISLLVIGLVLVSLKSYHLTKRVWVEKGVVLAVIGAIFMGASNFFVGFASRITNPLLTIWFVALFAAIICSIYLVYSNKIAKLVYDAKKYKSLILGMSILDIAAWICFAFASSLAPIAIVVALSESYVALASLLGLFINKEKLLTHQKLGLGISIVSIIILSVMAG